MQGGGCLQKQQSALTVILKLVISGLTSIILIVLGTAYFQFQSWFASISLGPVLRTVATPIMAAAWSSCSNFSTWWGFQYL